MIAASAEPRKWEPRRWLLVVVLIALLQTGLIFWLGARNLGRAHLANSGPRVYMPPDQRSELSGGDDPTLFVLASRHGFSGPAWLGVSPMENTLPDWTEPPLPLTRPVWEFGGTLRKFIATNLPAPLEVAGKPAPQMDAVELYLVPDLTSAESTLSIEGQLSDRPLLSQFKLKSWPAADIILTNSVVLAAVNQNGDVFSAVLLSKSGSKDADDNALNLAKSARFQPVRRSDPLGPDASRSTLNWGRLVFHWQTIALPATNAIPAP